MCDVEKVVVEATKAVRGAARIRIAICANRESQTQIAFNAPGVLAVEAQVIKVDRLFEPGGERLGVGGSHAVKEIRQRFGSYQRQRSLARTMCRDVIAGKVKLLP